VEYESTTITSSQKASEARQSPMRSASLNAIMQPVMRGRSTGAVVEDMMAEYLLFATERYALPILAPLAQALHASGQPVSAWFADGAAGASLPGVPNVGLQQALALRPRAVFSAANWVPPFIAGAKVQVFHGFNVQKRDSARGHFRVRGLFDLYCTQGPATTTPFRELAVREGHFAVAETGWPKLDPLFLDDGGASAALRAPAQGRPVILFGSTFTERLSAAPHLYEQIAGDIARGGHYWLLTLHPKCPPELFARYRALAGANAAFIEPEQVMAAQRAADVLVSDTSSIVSEFVVQHKPVVTFRNRVPQPHMIDFDDPAQLPAMLARALHPEPALMAEIRRYADDIHPWRDGRSSERVIAATEDFLAGEMGILKRKPFGAWTRGLQIRRDLGYWGPSKR
jgi:hypothetical protein